jgi:thermitase
MKSMAPRSVPREMLVKFKDGISQERIASILKDNRIDVIAEIQRGRLYHVRILDDRSVESLITQLTSHQEIEYAEPNYRYETQK